MKKTRALLVPIAFAVLAVTGVAQADGGLAVDRFTMSHGGGVSTGGAFELRGNIGDPNAGSELTGEGVTLTGGFLGLALASSQPTAAVASLTVWALALLAAMLLAAILIRSRSAHRALYD